MSIGRRNNTDTASFATTLSGVLGDWRSTYTGDAVFSDGRTEIDRRDGTGFDIADSRTWSFVNKATFIGNPLLLPAGEVTTTLDLGFEAREFPGLLPSARNHGVSLRPDRAQSKHNRAHTSVTTANCSSKESRSNCPYSSP